MKLLDLNVLHNTCNASKAAVTKGYRAIKKDGRSCWYKDNGSNILAVAHIDHVCQDKHFAHVKLGEELVVYSPRLDDRLGVYTIQHVLPLIGCNCDILLCDDEEKGQSTARLFETDKQYKWMVEFDRSGSDAVVYDYRSKTWKDALQSSGFNLGMGSYSDISYLEFLGVCGVNIGVGYYDYHGPRSHFIVSEWMSNLMKFKKFYNLHKGSEFEHIGYSSYYSDAFFDDSFISANTVIASDVLCPYCEEESLEESLYHKGCYHCLTCGDIVEKGDEIKNHKAYDADLPF